MKNALLIFIIGLSSVASASDNVDKIKTPGQAFIANLVYRTRIEIKNATYGPAKDIRVSRIMNRFKDVTLQDVHFESAGEKYVCRIKIHNDENIFLVGCKDSKGTAMHKKTGYVRANFFDRPTLEVKFPTGQAAEFEGPMGVESTKRDMRYYMEQANRKSSAGAQ